MFPKPTTTINSKPMVLATIRKHKNENYLPRSVGGNDIWKPANLMVNLLTTCRSTPRNLERLAFDQYALS